MTDRRLIEDFIPIKEISVEAAREKSIRKGHISTLHLWWARRPLVAARAAVFASLVAAPESYQKRSHLKKQMIDLCKWEAVPETISKAKDAILEAQRERLGLPVGTKLQDVPPPKVLDMFAGGGAIPLEALRLGCETFAVDLNPVAHIIELCTLVYPQRYGKKLADEVELWGNWVIGKVRSEIGDLYPVIRVGEVLADRPEQMSLLTAPPPKQLSLAQGLTPVAYLWTRTVKCPNPACGADVPLVRQTWLCKKAKKYVALRVIPNHVTMRVEFEVVEAATEKDLGFDPAAGSSRGNSTCRHCGTTVGVDVVKTEGMAGRIRQQLMAIVCTTVGEQGKTYLAGSHYERYVPDGIEIKKRLEKLCEETNLTTPTEPLPDYGVLGFRVQPYGLLKWEDLFTSRQLLALMTFVKWVRLAHDQMVQQGYEAEFAKAIATYLGIMCDRLSDRGSTICRWDNLRDMSSNTFSRQALPMVWDFAENNPLGNASEAQAQVEEPFHDDLAGERAGEGGVLSAGEQRQRKDGGRTADAQQRREKLVGVLDLGHLGVAAGVERRGGNDEDGGVDEQRGAERDGRVEKGELHRLAFAPRRFLVAPRLHDGRMQVQVVRHDGGAQNANAQVEHFAVTQDLAGGQEARRHPRHVGTRNDDLEQEAGTDRGDQHDDERLEHPEAAMLEEEDEHHVEGRDADAPGERDAEEQLERDRRTDHLSQVAGGDGDLAQHPQEERHGPRVMVAARLGEVAPGDDAQLAGEPLQQDRHQVGEQDDAEQGVAEARTARKRRGPVAGVHVTHRHQVPRPGKREQLAKPAGSVHRDRSVDLGERRGDARAPPARSCGFAGRRFACGWPLGVGGN